jgi:catechol 2,3-dioxygenase-like lactoylglutathione lyase family enzyme
MAVGEMRSFVIDVNDLEDSERFWASVLGLEVEFSAWQGQFSRVGRKGSGSILLQLVPEMKTDLKNRAHLDITVENVERAVTEVLGLGGA